MKIFLTFLLGAALGLFLGRSIATHQHMSPIDAPICTGSTVTGQGSEDIELNKAQRRSSDATEEPTALSLQQLSEAFERFKSGDLNAVEAAAAWTRLREDLTISDLPALASDLVASRGGDKTRMLREVFSVWAEKDPRSAFNFAQSIKPMTLRVQAMHSVLQTAGRSDYGAALALADGIEDRILLSRMRSAALTTLAQRDPAKAFAIARGKTKPNNPSLIMSILKEWTMSDPVAAQQAVVQLTGREGHYARQTIVDTLAEQDPQASWEYAKSLLDKDPISISPNSLRQVVKAWAQSDPAKAIEAAFTIEDLSQRQYALKDAAVTWATSDLKAALDFSLTIEDEGVRGKILSGLAENKYVDPATIFAALVEHAPVETFSKSLSEVIERWSRSDPQQAAAALLRLPVGDATASSAKAVAQEWVLASPADRQQILTWAASLPEGSARDAALKAVFSNWGAHDPSLALQVIASSVARNNSEALTGLIEGWGRKSPAEAARYALTLSAMSDKRDTIRDIVRSWSHSSPTDAAAFIQSTPEDMRPTLAQALVDSWADSDLGAAAAWVKAQPVGPSRDAGISVIADTIRSVDPVKALEWSQSISEEEQRSIFSQSILRSWLRDDPAAAGAWLAQPQVPQELRNKFAAER